MGTDIPAPLKAADVSRFSDRAAQLETARPVISYWCNYWVVNQILAKGLHNADDECLRYTTELMDKLEQFKRQHAEDETVTDDAVGQAYVEQFGLETFQRAENAMRANKTTLQTADTLRAAATFLDLGQIWGRLEGEVASKAKFAKFHAVRIVKAIKNGEDPNATNPKLDESEPHDGSEDNRQFNLEMSDAAVEFVEERGGADRQQRASSVERTTDDENIAEFHRRLSAKLSSPGEVEEPPPSSNAPPPPIPNAPLLGTLPTPPITSPRNMASRLTHSAGLPDLPAAPSDFANSPASGQINTPPLHPAGLQGNTTSLNTLQSFPPPSSEVWQPAHVSEPHSLRLPRPVSPDTDGEKRKSRSLAPVAAPPTRITPASQPQPVPQKARYLATATSADTAMDTLDDEGIAQAQKHARFAVSALNFDDVQSAISELKIALGHLGVGGG